MKHIGTYFSLFLLLFVTSCGANEETEESPVREVQLQTIKS